jgi:hypothetical protein
MEHLRHCAVEGRLRGVLCARRDVFDAIAGAEIYALSPSRGEAPTRPAAAQESLKTVLRRVEAPELEERRKGTQLVMHGTTSADGSFCLVEPRYEGGEVDLYAAISSLPLPGSQGRSAQLEQPWILYLGTYDPRQGPIELLLPPSIWCKLKRLFDIWTIVGRVTRCADPSAPLIGVKVRAFDVDWLADDELGSAVTLADGSFRIDYLGEKFRKGTFIDIELFGGPDVYFKIESSTGQDLLTEPGSKGREPGRADSGPCLCVDLCVDLPGGETGIPTAWTKIGLAFTLPAGPSLHSFDADGYAGAAKYGLSQVIRAAGSAPLKNGGNPVEYRFLVSSTTAPNGGPPVPPAAFTRVVGKDADAALFSPIQVGQMVRYVPFFEIVDIAAELEDLDAEGWLDVNRSILRTFSAHPTFTPADIPTFQYVDLDGLMGINTGVLTTAPDVPGGAAEAGQPIPAANLISVQKVAVRFEIRDGVSHAPLAGDGTTLNSMVINNNAVFAKIEVTEHQTLGSCEPLHGNIHLAYTVYHPLLQGMGLSVVSNDDGSYSVNMTDPPSLPLSGNTSPAVTGQNNPALTIPPPLHRCTYLVTLSAGPRLHTGDFSVGGATPQTTFYWEGP